VLSEESAACIDYLRCGDCGKLGEDGLLLACGDVYCQGCVEKDGKEVREIRSGGRVVQCTKCGQERTAVRMGKIKRAIEYYEKVIGLKGLFCATCIEDVSITQLNNHAGHVFTMTSEEFLSPNFTALEDCIKDNTENYKRMIMDLKLLKFFASSAYFELEMVSVPVVPIDPEYKELTRRAAEYTKVCVQRCVMDSKNSNEIFRMLEEDTRDLITESAEDLIATFNDFNKKAAELWENIMKNSLKRITTIEELDSFKPIPEDLKDLLHKYCLEAQKIGNLSSKPPSHASIRPLTHSLHNTAHNSTHSAQNPLRNPHENSEQNPLENPVATPLQNPVPSTPPSAFNYSIPIPSQLSYSQTSEIKFFTQDSELHNRDEMRENE